VLVIAGNRLPVRISIAMNIETPITAKAATSENPILFYLQLYRVHYVSKPPSYYISL
jgi:hypothetical protein